MMNNDPICVAFGASTAYCAHAAAVIASIVQRSPDARLQILMVSDEPPLEVQRQVEASAPNGQFIWRSIGAEDLPEFADREHFSRAILFRLKLPELAPASWRRLIYLDADLVVMGDVRRLWEADLGDAPIGAVRDAYIDPVQFGARWNLPEGGPGYLNSGVLLIDLDRVRAGGQFARAVEFVAQHKDEVRFADQDALNYVFWQNWAPLPPSWNAQRHMVLESIARTLAPEMRFDTRMPDVVHYTEKDKPWIRGAYHPWAWLYWRNLARTPMLSNIAAESGIGPLQRFRLWLRWLRRKPKGFAYGR